MGIDMWEQQMFNEWRRWHEEMEPRLLKLERDGQRGNALQQILKAERLAAERGNTESNEQEMRNVVNR
jgi:hypothetical protein